METIICIAEEGERKLIQQWLPDLEAKVVVTGVGALNIIHSLMDIDRETRIVNIGYCGSANFEIGSLVQVTESRLNHPNAFYSEPQQVCAKYDWGLFPPDGLIEAPCYTHTDFVLQSDYKDCAFDMELAFICALGFKEVVGLKVVSDNLNKSAYREVANGIE